MISPSLLDKYKSLKYEAPVTLFAIDWWRAKEGICPICTCKLYEMRNGKFLYCRSKKHKRRFLISKDKVHV